MEMKDNYNLYCLLKTDLNELKKGKLQPSRITTLYFCYVGRRREKPNSFKGRFTYGY